MNEWFKSNADFLLKGLLFLIIVVLICVVIYIYVGKPKIKEISGFVGEQTTVATQYINYLDSVVDGKQYKSSYIKLTNGINYFNVTNNQLKPGIYYVYLVSNNLHTETIKQIIK